MSWVQWQGEVWPVTDDEATLNVHLWRKDAGCPWQTWNFDLIHMLKTDNPESGERDCRKWISVEIADLHFHGNDWRRLSELEIRADSRWHDEHDYVHEYGRMAMSQVSARAVRMAGEPVDPKTGKRASNWVAHDFILHLGKRDGLYFPCELDAWMLREDEYYRPEPESAEEVARFPEGPPNLRVITRAMFWNVNVTTPQCDDPEPLARRYVREAIGCEEIFQPEVSWMQRKAPDDSYEPVPGWASTVRFYTQPAE